MDKDYQEMLYEYEKQAKIYFDMFGRSSLDKSSFEAPLYSLEDWQIVLPKAVNELKSAILTGIPISTNFE